MSRDDAKVAEALLELKAKAAKGLPWTKDERIAVDNWLEGKGVASILAACCILVSRRPKECPKSLGIIRAEIQTKTPEPYVELAIYEALLYVEPRHFASFNDTILSFINQSLTKRSVNLDNTICLLGNIARSGGSQALALLKSLAHDGESGVRENVSLVLRGLNAH